MPSSQKFFIALSVIFVAAAGLSAITATFMPNAAVSLFDGWTAKYILFWAQTIALGWLGCLILDFFWLPNPYRKLLHAQRMAAALGFSFTLSPISIASVKAFASSDASSVVLEIEMGDAVIASTVCAIFFVGFYIVLAFWYTQVSIVDSREGLDLRNRPL